jgi:hypothetical protein
MGILSTLTQYKLGRSSRQKFSWQLILWLMVFAGLCLAQPIYNWLFTNNLTQTEPLSLFDVMQITAIVVVFYIANRSRSHVAALERHVRDLHQELSILLSKDDHEK